MSYYQVISVQVDFLDAVAPSSELLWFVVAGNEPKVAVARFNTEAQAQYFADLGNAANPSA